MIQALFMRLDDVPPDDAELRAFVDRLDEITEAGGRISYVQVYTVARAPAEAFVSPLSNEEVDGIVALIQARTTLRAEAFYGG